MSPAAAEGKGGRPRAKGGKAEGAKGDRTEGAKGGREQRPAKAGTSRKRSNPLGRLRVGEAIYLVAAILLFILMFFEWFGAPGPANGEEPLGGVVVASGSDAWQALEVTPLFLMLAIAVAVGAAILRMSGSKWKPAVPPAAAVAALGGLAALLILSRIIAPPHPNGPLSELIDGTMTLELPIFLALAAALGIAYGGWRAMADEGTSFADVGKRLEGPSRPAKKKPVASAKPATAPKSAAKKPASPRRSAPKKP